MGLKAENVPCFIAYVIHHFCIEQEGRCAGGKAEEGKREVGDSSFL